MTILAVSYIYTLLFLIWYLNPHRGDKCSVTVLDIGMKPNNWTMQEWIDTFHKSDLLIVEVPDIDDTELSVKIEG